MAIPASTSRLAPPKTLHLKGGRQGVLLFHGLSSSPLELQFLARGLQRTGYTVRVPVMVCGSQTTTFVVTGWPLSSIFGAWTV